MNTPMSSSIKWILLFLFPIILSAQKYTECDDQSGQGLRCAEGITFETVRMCEWKNGEYVEAGVIYRYANGNQMTAGDARIFSSLPYTDGPCEQLSEIACRAEQVAVESVSGPSAVEVIPLVSADANGCQITTYQIGSQPSAFIAEFDTGVLIGTHICLLYTSPSPRDS